MGCHDVPLNTDDTCGLGVFYTYSIGVILLTVFIHLG